MKQPRLAALIVLVVVLAAVGVTLFEKANTSLNLYAKRAPAAVVNP